MTSPLEGLPEVLIQKILILAADDTKTLLRCEQTCKTLRNVVGNDTTWKHLGDGPFREDVRLHSNRDRACVATAIDEIRKEQEGSSHPNEGGITKNILVDELGVAGWCNLVNSILSDQASILLDCNLATNTNGVAVNAILTEEKVEGIRRIRIVSHHRFQFRGDTLYALAELVQEHMLIAFQRTHESSIELAEATGWYPVLTKRNFCRCDVLLREFVVEPNGLGWIGTWYVDRPTLTLDHAAEIIGDNNALLRERIVRRLSHRAGVARMDSEVYKWAWTFLVQLIMQLIRPACIELLDDYPRDITYQSSEVHVHTVVPRQIENAALSLFGSNSPHRVYGPFWLIPDVREGSAEWFEAMDREVNETEDQQELEDDTDVAQLLAETSADLEECDMMSISDDESYWSETYDNASDNGY